MGAEAPARDNLGTALGTVSHGPPWQTHKPSALLGGEERPETSPPFPRGETKAREVEWQLQWRDTPVFTPGFLIHASFTSKDFFF